MENVCLDANVIIDALTGENTRLGDRVIKKILSGSVALWEPALLSFEVAHVLGRLLSQKKIPAKAHETALACFHELPLLYLWNEELVLLAAKIQKEFNLSLYDASYIATAKIKQIPLITQDQDIIKKARKIHSAIFTPADWE